MSLLIKLVRHGESLANVGTVMAHEVGDHTFGLTPLGHEQAKRAGQTIGAEFFKGALTYCSPYQRARETLAGIFTGAAVPNESVRVYEDPRLREVEHGYIDARGQQSLRRTHGWFYYRFHGGESPADCFDRTSNFLEGLMRQVERKRAKRVLVITHGLTIRCFVMRFLHLTVEQFDMITSPANADIVSLGHKDELDQPAFVSGKWGVTGLRLRPEGTDTTGHR